MKRIYNIPGGFNRVYAPDPIGYTFIPSSTLKVEEAPFRYLIKALIIKIKKIIRIRLAKKSNS